MVGKERKGSGCLLTAEAVSPYSAVYPAMKMQLSPSELLPSRRNKPVVATEADWAELALAWLHNSPVLFLANGAVLAILLTSTCKPFLDLFFFALNQLGKASITGELDLINTKLSSPCS